MAEDRNYGAAQSAWSRFKSNNGSPHGFDRVAFNFKLTDIQAAIGLVQMKRLPRFLRERQRIARTYQRDLAGLPRIICPPFPDDPDGHVFQSFVCTWGSLEAASKGGTGLDDLEHSLSEFKLSLQRLGVAVSVAAQFLPELPVFNQARLRNQCPYAYAASRLTFALPIFHGMTKQETSYTLQSIKAVLAALPPD
jgi:perosamine synthetase